MFKIRNGLHNDLPLPPQNGVPVGSSVKTDGYFRVERELYCTLS